MSRALSIVKDSVTQDQLLSVLSSLNIHVHCCNSIEQYTVGNDDFELVFVDDQILDEPGLELILRLQEAEKSTKIVFLSSEWCAVATFCWLRDILNVSMVVFTPINPELLRMRLEQLKRFDISDNAAVTVETIHDTAGSAASVEKDGDVEAENKKLIVQKSILETQKRLRLEVEKEWSDLSRLVFRVFDENETDQLQTLIREAHKLKGSSGSLALNRVSVCAGKIEKYLRLFSPLSANGRSLLKAEIFRQLTIGKNAMSLVEPAASRLIDHPDRGNNVTILLVGESDRNLLLLEQAFGDCLSELVYLDDPIKLLEAMCSIEPDLVALSGEWRFLAVQDICRRLHEDERWNRASIILLQPEELGIAYGDLQIPDYVHCFPSLKRFEASELVNLVRDKS